MAEENADFFQPLVTQPQGNPARPRLTRSILELSERMTDGGSFRSPSGSGGEGSTWGDLGDTPHARLSRAWTPQAVPGEVMDESVSGRDDLGFMVVGTKRLPLPESPHLFGVDRDGREISPPARNAGRVLIEEAPRPTGPSLSQGRSPPGGQQAVGGRSAGASSLA